MIGVYDSGIGGLSVWRELYALMPEQEYLYICDAAHCPYGDKPVQYIIDRADVIVTYMIFHGADMVVVACNTATAAAIDYLRHKYSIPFVGMEPAVKPAATVSRSGVVGVLATANTLKGSLYHNTLERFGSGVKVVERVGEGLVELVERGEISGPAVEKLLHKYIDPMVEAGADAIVLGCTHYPFLSEAIARVAGPSVRIIDPAPAVAQQARRLLDTLPHPSHPSPGHHLTFISNADTTILSKFLKMIIPDTKGILVEEVKF